MRSILWALSTCTLVPFWQSTYTSWLFRQVGCRYRHKHKDTHKHTHKTQQGHHTQTHTFIQKSTKTKHINNNTNELVSKIQQTPSDWHVIKATSKTSQGWKRNAQMFDTKRKKLCCATFIFHVLTTNVVPLALKSSVVVLSIYRSWREGFMNIRVTCIVNTAEHIWETPVSHSNLLLICLLD